MAAALAAGSFGTHELGNLVLRLIKEYGGHIIGAIFFKLQVNEVKNLYTSVLKALGVGGGDTVFHNSSVALGRNSTLAHLLPNITLSSAELEIAALIIDPKDISTGFREVGGFRDVKRSLMDSTLSMVAHVEGLGGQPTQGILLYGPPGCGKTTLVRALAKERNVPLVPLMPGSLLRKYVGDTSLLTHAVFALCSKLEPCILFIDEADSIFKSRHDDEHSVDRTLKTEIMQLWDDLIRNEKQVLVIGCTNRPQDLDPAIKRRFERSHLIGLPDEKARVEVFRALLRTTELDATFDLSQCAKATEGYSPSDIRSLLKVAAQIPVREFIRKQRKAGGNGGAEESEGGAKVGHPARGDKVKVRPLLNQDIEKALQTVYPTTWTSSAYDSDMPHAPSYPRKSLNRPNRRRAAHGDESDNTGDEDEDEDEDEDDGH